MPADNLTRDGWGLPGDGKGNSECVEEPGAAVLRRKYICGALKCLPLGFVRHVLARKLDIKPMSALYLVLLA